MPYIQRGMVVGDEEAWQKLPIPAPFTATPNGAAWSRVLLILLDFSNNRSRVLGNEHQSLKSLVSLNRGLSLGWCTSKLRKADPGGSAIPGQPVAEGKQASTLRLFAKIR